MFKPYSAFHLVQENLADTPGSSSSLAGLCLPAKQTAPNRHVLSPTHHKAAVVAAVLPSGSTEIPLASLDRLTLKANKKPQLSLGALQKHQ